MALVAQSRKNRVGNGKHPESLDRKFKYVLNRDARKLTQQLPL